MLFKLKIEKQVGDSRIVAKLIDAKKHLYKLEEDFTYTIRYKGISYVFNIPAGFLTNFASVPKIFWKLFHPLEEKLLVASCVHDFVLNEFYELQPSLTRTIKVDTEYKEIHEVIDGFLAADLFFFSMSQEGSYNLPIRQVLRFCVKGYYFLFLKGWLKVR